MMERRQHRSTDPSRALEHLLDAVASRSRVSTVAVVDAEGRVVACRGPASEARAVARVAQALAGAAADTPLDDAMLPEGVADVVVRRVADRSPPLFVGGVGSSIARLADAARGVGRILGETG